MSPSNDDNGKGEAPSVDWWAFWISILGDTAFMLSVVFALTMPFNTLLYLCTNMNMQAPFTAFIIWTLCFSPQPSLTGRVLGCWPFVWLGDLGYGFYLFHCDVLYGGLWGDYRPQGLRGTELWHWPAFLVGIFVTYLKAWVLFNLVEFPVQKLVQYLRSCHSAG